MASEIANERNNQTQELRDLQETYRKRRQAVDEQGQNEIQKVRKGNDERIKVEKSTGDAVVNHLKEGNQERIEQLKNDGEQKLTYERKDLNKRFQSENEHSKQEGEAVEQNIANRRAHLEQEMRKQSRQESELRAHESEATNTIEHEQSIRRAKIMGQDQAELHEYTKHINEEKDSIAQKSHKELADAADTHRKQMAQLHDQHSEIFTKQEEWSREQLKNQREKSQQHIEAQRQDFAKTEGKLRDHAQTEIKQEQENDTKKFFEVKKENRTQLDRARDAGTKNMEKTRAYYDKNIATIEKAGDAKINEQTTTQEQRLRNEKEVNKAQLKKIQEDHQAEMKDNEVVFKNQKEISKNSYRDSLLEQRKQYEIAFNKNLKSFEEQVRSQHEMLAESLVREKRQVMEDIGKYSSQNSDPFYRISDPKAELAETASHYIVRTKVPEHEKDNVKVLVHENKVVVQGGRRFEDKVEDAQSKIATNNYQTYRQEIALEHPVLEKHFAKSYEDGVLTIRIPKA